jgi:hypothetical protein
LQLLRCGSALLRRSVGQMTGAALQSIGLEFQPFLYAQIGDDANGVPLSVISALARRNIDPWEQAARWSRVTPRSAIKELAELIAALPLAPEPLQNGHAAPAAVPDEIATRLVALLPNQRNSPAGAPAAAATLSLELATHPVITKRVRIIIFCVISGLLGQWLFSELNNSSPLDNPQAPPASRAPGPGSQP